MISYFPVVTGSLSVSGSVNISGGITASGGITISGSIASASYAASATSASYAVTSSYANNLTVAGTLTAQTLVVQTITSSVVYSSGSNVFGNNIANTQTFTGSMNLTGSLTVVTTGTEFQVTSTGVKIGNVIGDSHNITGSVNISGPATFSSSITVNGDNSIFNGGTANNFNTYALGIANTKYLVFVSPAAAQAGGRNWSGGVGADASENVLIGAYNNLSLAAGSLTTRMTILGSNGNVGIGTTNPGSFKLWVSGSQLIDGTLQMDSGVLNSPKAIAFNANSSTGGTYGDINWYNVQWDGYTRGSINVESDGALSNGRMIFKTGASGANAVERMRIASNGELYLATAGLNGLIYTKPNGSSYSIFLYSGANANVVFSGGTGGFGINNYANSVRIVQVSDSGGMTIQGTLAQNGSDERIKKNVELIPNAIEKIKTLRGVTFEWNKDIFPTDRTTDIGVIAQDVQAILPDAVTLAPFDINFEDNTSKSGKNYLTVYYEKLIPLLIEGIKELNTKFEDYKATHP